MSYRVKEIFYSLQGEGFNAGRPAVFLRFSGCNLWSGHENTRATAICKFCDTDFVGGEKFATAAELAEAVANAGGNQLRTFVVCTGGEPLLQMDSALTAALRLQNCEIAVETNGTVPVPDGVDWVTVSPKAATTLRVRRGNELKLVFPQVGAEPEMFAGMEFNHFFLQPMDGPEVEANAAAAIEYCLKHPQWRLSLQTHKFVGIR